MRGMIESRRAIFRSCLPAAASNTIRARITTRAGVLRGLNDGKQCANVLQRLAATRGVINSQMRELLEGHIRIHMPHNSKSSEEEANDVIEVVRPYVK